MSMNIQDDHTDESEHEPSSEPDSDSDNRNSRPKKRKIKFKRHKKSDSAELNKPNKYTIWCKTVQVIFKITRIIYIHFIIRFYPLCSF